MVTANILREVWKGVILAHKDGMTFTDEWSEVLDSDSAKHLPNVKWMPPQVQLVQEGNVMRSLFTVNLFFEDNHEADRRAGTREDVYERMQVIASHCFMFFKQTYLDTVTTYQGVPVLIAHEGAATLTAAFDQPGEHITGCRLSATFRSDVQFCADDYFNAIT